MAYAKLLNDILGLLNNVNLYNKVIIGSMPSDNGIAMYLSAGAPDITDFKKNTINEISLVINAKHENQLICLQALSDIHKHLTTLKDYPGDILDIETGTAPNYLGQEDNGQWLYGSILDVKFIIRSDN